MANASKAAAKTAPTTIPAICPPLRLEPASEPDPGFPPDPPGAEASSSADEIVTMSALAPSFQTHADTLNVLRS